MDQTYRFIPSPAAMQADFQDPAPAYRRVLDTQRCCEDGAGDAACALGEWLSDRGLDSCR